MSTDLCPDCRLPRSLHPNGGAIYSLPLSGTRARVLVCSGFAHSRQAKQPPSTPPTT